ncbi:hypothetical protein [Kamptonema formosum]|uniref:hypothetical protein n=1 Tax=Kamptonema formosum TaxID=331992 RepID=UPI0003492524|nr:hypothetical protein [Kamptonema formosum]
MTWQKKGYKSQRNQPEIYEEVKKTSFSWLKPRRLKDILRSLATAQGISQSEFIERLMREIKSANSRTNCSIYPQECQAKLTNLPAFVQD